MGLRFRRSFKVAPGVRLNLSGRGASLTLGPRGASLNFGSRGTFLNTGIPGTGLYSRTRLDSGTTNPSPRQEKVDVTTQVSVYDDGTVRYLDMNGQPLSPYLTTLVKRQQGDRVRALLQEAKETVNSEYEALERIHVFTPFPNDVPIRPRQPFNEAPPTPPIPKTAGLIAGLFENRDEIEAENAKNLNAYAEALARWEAQRQLFEEWENKASQVFDNSLRTDLDFMQQILETRLQEIIWPRETLVSFEIADAGSSVHLDVDLPEVEDLPRRIATVPQRGYKLTLKEVKGNALQEHYARHVHGIGFRIIGEVFATLPTVARVILSGYTQRAEATTGQLIDTYIYSVGVYRNQWEEINFRNLTSIDVVACLDRFELRRVVSRDGSFQAITPLED